MLVGPLYFVAVRPQYGRQKPGSRFQTGLLTCIYAVDNTGIEPVTSSV
jgi:hypothetical protein